MPEALLEAIIIEKTGWTHEEYIAQPHSLILTLLTKMNTLNRIENEQAKKAAGG